MRIVTWNLGRRRRQTNEKAWTYLRNVLHADIALLQEAAAPGDSELGHLALQLTLPGLGDRGLRQDSRAPPDLGAIRSQPACRL
jgi:hypothetical protein